MSFRPDPSFRPSVLPVGADRSRYILVVAARHRFMPIEHTHLAMPGWTSTVCGVDLPAVAIDMQPTRTTILRCSNCHYAR